MLSFWNIVTGRTFYTIVFSLMVLVGLGGLVGNGLVLWLLGFRVKRNPFSVYVLHLAGADFLFLGCQTVFAILTFTRGHQQLYLVITFLWFTIGLGLMVALSLEQCLSVLFPKWSGCRPKHASACACALVWALSLPLVLVPSHACGLLTGGSSFLTCFRYQVANIICMFLLFSVLCVSNFILLVRVQCCSQNGQKPPFYGFILQMAPLFFFCGLPFLTYWALKNTISFIASFFSFFLSIAELLACVNSSTKPAIYFFNAKHRQELQRAWPRRGNRRLTEALEMRA
ncbi:mas-related G-protein coupled receptor member G [Dromiciops gliroides]|uniref:mas-related G-protein coupled receptor member G n=1 Tax=Dromiciops gliroides TaxID=33562 RepID=UPI001CC54573|nr:mas-related G-protein coupled receptor member G [Dromiciops gliroides]